MFSDICTHIGTESNSMAGTTTFLMRSWNQVAPNSRDSRSSPPTKVMLSRMAATRLSSTRSLYRARRSIMQKMVSKTASWKYHHTRMSSAKKV